MKNHLIIWLNDKADQIPSLPFWGDLIKNKTPEAYRFIQAVEDLFGKYNVPAIYTNEYKPRLTSWSSDEIASQLHRVFRVILLQDRAFPERLVEEIKLLPVIKQVKMGGIGVAEIPKAVSMAIPGPDHTALIYLREAHAFSQGHQNIKIAVLDTGVDTHHPEINHAMLPGMDYVDILDGAGQFIGDYLGYDTDPDDEVGHGTHVCGILAAQGKKMNRGVAPDCKIIPVRVLGALKKDDQVVGAGLIDNINNGIKWAVDQGADIINMSLGIKHEGGGLPHAEVIQYARQKGVSIVAASGNDGTHDLYYPGALPGVMAVGAVDATGRMAPFSTYGSHVSFVAPGTNIISSFPHKQYTMSSGTSQASPFVAGAIALLKSYALKFGRTLKDSQVKYLLKHTADRSDTRLKDMKSGYGCINLLDALKLLQYKLSTQ